MSHCHGICSSLYFLHVPSRVLSTTLIFDSNLNPQINQVNYYLVKLNQLIKRKGTGTGTAPVLKCLHLV
ncbi:hypothetical protein HanIR_Chr16g0801581 [Helianthus annuus]|nr:hypothetical protein HanIR_Chr16g0801581 [Helianthus annuus]